MFKLVFCLHRRPELSREAFQTYWRDTHAPLVKAAKDALGIRRYVQEHTFDSDLAAGAANARGIPAGEGHDYDGVAELWFDSEEALARIIATPEAQKHGAILAEDEARFIDFSRSRFFYTHANEVIV